MEAGGRHDDAVARPDARQCLQPDDLGRFETHDRLIVRKYPAFDQCLIDFGDGTQTLGHRGAHALPERHEAAAIDILGVVKREIGILVKRALVEASGALEHPSRRQRRRQGHAPVRNRQGHRVDQRLGGCNHLRLGPAGARDEGELVAA